MKILIAIPHVFDPKEGSLYSSQNEEKRKLKAKALYKATIGNLDRHSNKHWIHASLGKAQKVVTRELETDRGHDITIHLYTPPHATLANTLPVNKRIKLINPGVEDLIKVPLIASKNLLLQATNYDLVAYIEDDILIEDTEFFEKIIYLINYTNGNYAFMPHRCEYMKNIGDVILSGDPDGGRSDLFWDTKEEINIQWNLGLKTFYRATNPHSGCYFLSKDQASKAAQYWIDCNWKSNFQLSGPLEQAASGLILPTLKIMKPTPAQYRFLMVRHQDELWKRHPFEEKY